LRDNKKKKIPLNDDCEAKSIIKSKKTGNIISFAFEKISPIKKKTNKLKCKICLLVFEAFKKNENFKSFKLFSTIEKKIFGNTYDKLSDMAEEVRSIFNEYFSNFASDSKNYQKIFDLFSHFENVYKEYESKKFINETKNILEIKKKFNKLQKIVKYNKYSNSQNNSESRLMRFDENGSFYAYEPNREKKISNIFKLELLNNIKKLNTFQIREMIKLVQDPNKTVDSERITSIELDINKLSHNKIKELDRFVRRCMLEDRNKFSREYNYYRYSNDFEKNSNSNNNLNVIKGNQEFNKYENKTIWDETDKENNKDIYGEPYLKDFKVENYLLGKKQKRDFFSLENEKNDEFEKEHKKFNNEKRNKDYKDNSINCNNYNKYNNSVCKTILKQSPTQNNEKLDSYTIKFIKQNKSERKNSLDLNSDIDSEESSDEESYSDLEIGKFKF